MIIYVAIKNGYEHNFVEKAFSDKKKAQEYVNKANKEDAYSWYEIEEIELEK